MKHNHHIGFIFIAITIFCLFFFTNCSNKQATILMAPPLEVQTQVKQNILNTIAFLDFAEENLNEYSNLLNTARTDIASSNYQSNISQKDSNDKKEIRKSISKCIEVLESARFNNIPLFPSEQINIVPVILNATTPALKLSFSTDGFDRKALLGLTDKIRLNPLDQSSILSSVDNILLSLTTERNKVSSYRKRLVYAQEVNTLIFSNKTSLNKKEEITKIINSIEVNLLALAIQSANGITNNEDRKLLQYEYNELYGEAVRIISIYGIPKEKAINSKSSIESQKEAEESMIFYSKTI